MNYLFIYLLSILICINIESDNILKEVFKSEKNYYRRYILPNSLGNKNLRKSYQSIVKRKYLLKKEVVSRAKIDLNDYDTIFFIEGASGSDAYGYILAHDLYLTYFYESIRGTVDIKLLSLEEFKMMHNYTLLNEIYQWKPSLKNKPKFSSGSNLLGGLAYLVTKVDKESSVIIETIGFYGL